MIWFVRPRAAHATKLEAANHLHGTTGMNGSSDSTYSDGFRDGQLDLYGFSLPDRESHWLQLCHPEQPLENILLRSMALAPSESCLLNCLINNREVPIINCQGRLPPQAIISATVSRLYQQLPQHILFFHVAVTVARLEQ